MTTTDTPVSNLIINTMTQAQYSQITPSNNELYLVTDSTITSSDVTTALGYTPYDSSNPSGYTSNTGTVTSVNNTSPDGSGNVSITIPTVPTNISSFNNDSGYITGIDGSDVTTALGYTPTSPANVDGQWTYSLVKIVESISNTNSTKVYLGSNGTPNAGQNYLPSDTNKYEVMFTVRLGCNENKSQNVGVKCGTDIIDTVSNIPDYMFTCNKHATRMTNTMILPVGENGYFEYSLYGSDSNVQFFTVYAIGYRRIGTNS